MLWDRAEVPLQGGHIGTSLRFSATTGPVRLREPASACRKDGRNNEKSEVR